MRVVAPYGPILVINYKLYNDLLVELYSTTKGAIYVHA